MSSFASEDKHIDKEEPCDPELMTSTTCCLSNSNKDCRNSSQPTLKPFTTNMNKINIFFKTYYAYL